LFLSREGKKKLKKALLSLSMLITQRKKQLVKTLGPEQGKRLTHLHATGVTLQILEGTAPLFVDLIRLEGGMAIRRDAGWGSRFFGWSDDELGQVTFELDEAAGQGHIFWQQADQKLTFGFQAERWKEVEAFFSVYQVIAREDESRLPLSDEKRLHDLLGKSGTTPDTDPAWGRFLWWLGVVLLLGFLYIMIRWLWQDEGAESYFLWRTLAILGVLGIGYFFLQPGAKHRQKDARTALEQDARPPVLYLRSFMDDEADSQDTPPMINPLGKMISDEQLLVDALKAVGPVICLGRQGEELPPLGAHRQYVADDHWQTTIQTAMQVASLVCFRLNTTPNLLWELREARRLVTPHRLLFYVPPMGIAECQTLQQFLQTALGDDYTWPDLAPDSFWAPDADWRLSRVDEVGLALGRQVNTYKRLKQHLTQNIV
jgi:hypothetical protein